MVIGTVANLVQKGMFASGAELDQSGGLTAAGSAQADALALAANKDVYVVTTAAASTGVRLPAPTAVGDTVVVVNGGANAIKVYAAGTGTVNGVATATGVSVATLKGALLVAVSAGPNGNWVAVYA